MVRSVKAGLGLLGLLLHFVLGFAAATASNTDDTYRLVEGERQFRTCDSLVASGEASSTLADAVGSFMAPITCDTPVVSSAACRGGPLSLSVSSSTRCVRQDFALLL